MRKKSVVMYLLWHMVVTKQRTLLQDKKHDLASLQVFTMQLLY